MTFGETIKRLREERGWTKKDLEVRAGLRNRVSPIETTGQIPGPDVVLKLCRALDLDPEDTLAQVREEKVEQVRKERERQDRLALQYEAER